MTLSHHFATQRLAGGQFHRLRYMASGNYQPLVLTEAGSVFVFKVVDPESTARVLSAWSQHGLPLPEGVKVAHGRSWNEHPYLPENGFGEVTVRPLHDFSILATDSAAA